MSFLYISIEPPETFNVNKTYVSLSYFKEKIEMIWQNYGYINNFGPKQIKTHQSRSNLDQIKNKKKLFQLTHL